MTEQRWIFVIKIHRQPGVLNAVTGVFTNWGIGLQTAMLNERGTEGADGIVILSFQSSPRKKAILERTVSRLSRVTDIKSYPYETNDLRMIAACTVDINYQYEKTDNVEIEELNTTADRKLLYVSGTVKEVDHYISPMLEKKELLDLVKTILTT